MPFVNVSAQTVNDSTTPIDLAATSLTAGNLILVAVRFDPPTPGPTVSASGITDTAGNTYVELANFAGGDRFAVFYCLDALGHASNVVSIAVTGTFSFGWAVSIQWSGLTSFDDFVTNTAGLSGNIHAGNITPADTNEVAFIFTNHTGIDATSVFADVSDGTDVPAITKRTDSGVIAIATAPLTLAGVAHDFVEASNTSLQRMIVVGLFAPTGGGSPGSPGSPGGSPGDVGETGFAHIGG